jgi:hypothetical protein
MLGSWDRLSIEVQQHKLECHPETGQLRQGISQKLMRYSSDCLCDQRVPTLRSLIGLRSLGWRRPA